LRFVFLSLLALAVFTAPILANEVLKHF
jgi:hypothetical protein